MSIYLSFQADPRVLSTSQNSLGTNITGELNPCYNYSQEHSLDRERSSLNNTVSTTVSSGTHLPLAQIGRQQSNRPSRPSINRQPGNTPMSETSLYMQQNFENICFETDVDQPIRSSHASLNQVRDSGFGDFFFNHL